MSDHRTTPYVVLGLEPNASKEQVKEAFRKLCMTYHPDKQQHGGNIVAAEAKFRMIKVC
jgi:curved DNA-binding protein CbpA